MLPADRYELAEIIDSGATSQRVTLDRDPIPVTDVDLEKIREKPELNYQLGREDWLVRDSKHQVCHVFLLFVATKAILW